MNSRLEAANDYKNDGQIVGPRDKHRHCLLAFLLINLTSICLIENVEAFQQQQTPASGHQTMAQMLQVFNGNDSNQLEANHFKLLEVVHNEWLLVGGR